MMDAPSSAPAEQFNFAQFLIECNTGRAAKLAYRDDARELSYGDLHERIRRFARVLMNHGVRREERVLLVMQDTVDWPVAFLGALYAGIVPVAVNTLLTRDDYAYMLRNSRAQLVLTSGPLLGVVRSALALGGHEVKDVLVATPGHEPLEHGEHALSPLIDAAAPLEQAAATGCDEMAFWLYSSGSTGKPKGTVHSHGNLYWTSALYARQVLGIRETDIVFSAAKLYFAYGLGNALTFPLMVGATTILMPERPTPQAVFRRLVEDRPTIFYGVPTLYAGMLAAPELPSREQVALRVCTSAGEALPREVGERFTAHFGCEILDGIGSTEMLHIFLSNRPGEVRYGTTGKPVPGYEIALRDDAGRPVPAGEIGDLYVKGPSAALMYWGNREKSRATFQGEWLRSGDKYSVDADGYYTYAGRSDDMLKVGGQYVSPFEVEAALIGHADVLEAAVIGVPDGDGLIKTKAFVVLKPGHAPSSALAEELKQFVKSCLAPHKYPRTIDFVSDLPKTATGKIQRFRLRESEAVARP